MSDPVMDDTESILSRRLVRYGLIWGVWTIVGLFFTTQIYVSDYVAKQPIRYTRPLLVQTSACYLWALATPLVLWLSRRYCIQRHNWLRRSAFHFVFSLILSSVLLALHYLALMVIFEMTGSLTSFLVFRFVY